MNVSATIINIVTSLLLGTNSPAPIKYPHYPVSEIACMTEAIFFEAGNLKYRDKQAIGNTIVNRLRSGKFADTICKIVSQKGQFSYQKLNKSRIVNLKTNQDNLVHSAKVAIDVLTGKSDITNGATYFINPHIAKNTAWLIGMRKTTVINQHHFYKDIKKNA